MPRRRRTWTFDLILTTPPVHFDDHPLAGLSSELRDDLRTQAFGRILAAIAMRKSETLPSRDVPPGDGQVQANPKPLTEGG